MVPPPTITKRYLNAGSRHRAAQNTATTGRAKRPPLVRAGVSTDSDVSVVAPAPKSQSGAVLGYPGQVLPARAKRRWQRADSQIHGYFTSLIGSKNLAAPDVSRVKVIDDFGIQNEEFCTKNEEFCIQNDEFCR